MKWINKFLYPAAILIIAILFFYQTFIKGLLPIPADTIIGLYHPFRDLYSKNYPNGIPYKNFLITDPVRQEYPWKKLVIDTERRFEVPLWNPYSFSGTPLLANFQSSPFYPLNILMIILPFDIGWAALIFSQVVLAGIFMFLYLRNQKLRNEASFIASISFAFSGFFIAWLEWGTVLSTALWAPLVLLAFDKVFEGRRKWVLVLIFGLSSSFFGGHLQVFFYTAVLYILYALFLVLVNRKRQKNILLIVGGIMASIIIVIPQLIPTLQFISLSARSIDLNWQVAGWFIPFEHLVQFVVPDFFGNPTTLNYFGVWNYGEMIGYVGILPLLMAFFSIVTKQKKVLFFWILIIVSLILALPTPIAKIPYVLNLPFLSTAQPTRLIFLIDLSLSVLAGFGFNYFLENKNVKKPIFIIIGLLVSLFGIITAVIFLLPITHLNLQDLSTAKRNLYFPGLIITLTSVILLAYSFLKNKKVMKVALFLLILITILDLFRFGWKFTPFTKKEYIFPSTKILNFLGNQNDKNFRIMSDNSEIFPPNFSSVYHLQDVSGYDPLYLLRYGEFISAMERGVSDISAPFGFNRIITPRNYASPLFPLLNVKYLLSFSTPPKADLKLIMSEGKTNLYENNNFIPRTFLVESVIGTMNKKQSMAQIYDSSFNPLKTAVVENLGSYPNLSTGTAKIVYYSENKVQIQVSTVGEGFLVLLDTYYPTWEVRIDGKISNIFITDYNFRGVMIPQGSHMIEFRNKIL